MAKKTFGKEDYNIDKGSQSDKAKIRSSSLEYRKKAVSFFMLNKKPTWCNGQGNPTKSDAVTDLIKDVKKCEVRRIGVPSKANHRMTRVEFRKEMKILRGGDDWNHHYNVYMAVSLG